MKYVIFLILSFCTVLQPASGKNIRNSEDLLFNNSASNVRQVDRSHDNGNAILLAQALTFQQPTLARPDALDAAPGVFFVAVVPKPQTLLDVGGLALPPAGVLVNPSKTSRFGIIAAMIRAAHTFDTRRTFAGESPLAAVFGMLAGILMVVGIDHLARRAAPALRR